MTTSDPEPKFRRGIFVMLVCIGLIAFGALAYGRQSSDAVHDAQRQVVAARAQNAAQQKTLDELLKRMKDNDADARDRSTVATNERNYLAQRQLFLEVFVVQVLQKSTDPGIRAAAQHALDSAAKLPKPKGLVLIEPDLGPG